MTLCPRHYRCGGAGGGRTICGVIRLDFLADFRGC